MRVAKTIGVMIAGLICVVLAFEYVNYVLPAFVIGLLIYCLSAALAGLFMEIYKAMT